MEDVPGEAVLRQLGLPAVRVSIGILHLFERKCNKLNLNPLPAKHLQPTLARSLSPRFTGLDPADVTTDILFLKKWARSPQANHGRIWQASTARTARLKPTSITREMMLGLMKLEGTMYRGA